MVLSSTDGIVPYDYTTNDSLRVLKQELIDIISVTSFKELFAKLPNDLKKRIYALKNIDQNKVYHPEGNVLKHTITVVNRALKHSPNDINLALAGLFHDIGKVLTKTVTPEGSVPLTPE